MRLYIPLANAIRSYWHRVYNRAFSDQRLAIYLYETFESELPGTQIDGLRFYVKKRILTIHGTLYREVDHEQVLRIAGRIAGLRAIVDRINIVKDVHLEDANARIHLLLNDRPETRRLIPA